MLDIAYADEVYERILVLTLLEFDLNSIRADWFCYSWVIRALESVRILISTHGSY